MFLENVTYEVYWNECVWKLCENIDWECYLRMVIWEFSDSGCLKGLWEIANNSYLKEFLRECCKQFSKNMMQTLLRSDFERLLWKMLFESWFWQLFSTSCHRQLSTSCFQRFLRSDSERLLQTVVNVSLPKITSQKLIFKGFLAMFFKMEHQ